MAGCAQGQGGILTGWRLTLSRLLAGDGLLDREEQEDRDEQEDDDDFHECAAGSPRDSRQQPRDPRRELFKASLTPKRGGGGGAAASEPEPELSPRRRRRRSVAMNTSQSSSGGGGGGGGGGGESGAEALGFDETLAVIEARWPSPDQTGQPLPLDFSKPRPRGIGVGSQPTVVAHRLARPQQPSAAAC